MKLKWKELFIAIFIPILIGLISSFLSNNTTSSFNQLIKPPFSPPAWLFSIVWMTLYILMGVASYFIYISNDKNKKSALSLYALSLVFNFLWPILFFNFHLYFVSFLWIIALEIIIILTITSFYSICHLSAYLLIPYLVWVAFAAYLNYAIAILNK